MKRVLVFALSFLFFILFTACNADGQTTSQEVPLGDSSAVSNTEETPSASIENESESDQPSKESESMKIKITVDDTTLTAVPEENSSAEAFLAMLEEGPVTISMSDYAGMEKVGPLGRNLPQNDAPISVDAGDVILYQGNQITIYYDTNTWSFTKLATIEGATKESLLDVLGSGDVTVTFSLAES